MNHEGHMPHERVICLHSNLNGCVPVLGLYCAHWWSWMKACVLSLPCCLRIGVRAWHSLLLSLFHNLFSGFNVYVAVFHAAGEKLTVFASNTGMEVKTGNSEGTQYIVFVKFYFVVLLGKSLCGVFPTNWAWILARCLCNLVDAADKKSDRDLFWKNCSFLFPAV